MKKENILNLFVFSFLLTLIGLILLFIKWQIGLLLIALFIGVSFFINTKYPNEFKEILKEAKTREAKKVKKISINHIGGIKNTDQNQKCYLRVKNSQIYISDLDNKQLIELNLSDIENVCILEEINITQKDKSVISRAIAGGLILGPVGAVVGAMSGLTPKMQQNKKYYLEIRTSKTNDIIITASLKILKEIKKVITL